MRFADRQAMVRWTGATLLCACGAASLAGAQATWTMREAWRIGGEASGPTAFVYVKGLAVDAGGRVFVYDRATQDIRVFGPDGKLVRIIGRKGSGPGELRDAEGIAMAPDGKLWVRDAANARFTVFSGAGAYERTWTTTFCMSQSAWTPRMDEPGRFIDEDCVVSGGRAVSTALLAFDTDRQRVDTIAPKPECGSRELAEAARWVTRSERGTTYRTIPFAPRAMTALGRAGTVWCVPTSGRFEVLGISPGARDTVRITRRVAAVPVPQAERDAIIADFRAQGVNGLDYDRMPTVRPAIEQLSVDDQGRLWVRATTGQGVQEFTVYSPTGAPVATAVLGRYKLSPYFPLVLRGSSLYTVVFDEDDVSFVTHFRIGQ